MAAVATLFAAREAEFAFNPAIGRLNPAFGDFSADPARFLPTDAAVILTTWADALRPSLVQAGFTEEVIPWPAGPDGSSIFRRGSAGPLTYLEIVNEEDPKIAPAHLILWQDTAGLVGGTITAISGDAAWLAVMVIRPDAEPGSGTRLWQTLAADLAARGIRRIDLGTQTAEAFYLRQGLTTTTRAVTGLRSRPGPQGPIWNDLVMMTGRL
ncbi:MAG: hypothetical protein ACRCS0_13015 [Albidovulum sp.]